MKNFGIITEKDYIGKTIEDGFISRITENDGNSYMLTMDFRADRINFRVNKGIVIDVNGG